MDKITLLYSANKVQIIYAAKGSSGGLMDSTLDFFQEIVTTYLKKKQGKKSISL